MNPKQKKYQRLNFFILINVTRLALIHKNIKYLCETNITFLVLRTPQAHVHILNDY